MEPMQWIGGFLAKLRKASQPAYMPKGWRAILVSDDIGKRVHSLGREDLNPLFDAYVHLPVVFSR